MKNKKLLAVTLGMTMMLQICLPASAADIIVEPAGQAETVQESDGSATEPADGTTREETFLASDIVEESVVSETDTVEGDSARETNPAEGDTIPQTDLSEGDVSSGTDVVQDNAEAAGTPDQGNTVVIEEDLDEADSDALTGDQAGGESDLLVEAETELLFTESSDLQSDENLADSQTGTEPETELGMESESGLESESESESDLELMWDGELSLDLTDTTQMYTVYNAPARAAEHTHQMSVECGSGEGSIVFDQPLTSITQLEVEAGGNFYLEQDIEMVRSGSVTIPAGATVNLCLNGYSIDKYTWQTGFYIYVNEGATLNLCDCQGSGTITGGHGNSSGHGGAILNNGTFHMYGGTISENGAGGKNHGIYSNGNLYIHGGAVANIESTDSGAGVYVPSGTFEMTGGTISGNTLDRTGSSSIGGAGVAVKNADFVMTGGTIANNTSDRDGGGVAVRSDGDYKEGYKGASFTISGNSIIEGNTTEKSGGAVYIGPGATVTMNGGVIRRNSASGYGGGAVYMMGGMASGYIGYAKLIINNGIIEKNESDTGTIHQQGISSVYMYGGEIRDNTAVSGGAIYAIPSQSVAPTVIELAGGKISENEVESYGGGLFLNGAATTISGTIITGNKAAYGGGVHAYTNDLLKVTGGVITGNFASERGGGISYEYNITEEDVNGSGSDVYDPILLAGTPVINGNTAGKRGNNLFLFDAHEVRIDGAITDDASVGVTVQYPPEDDDIFLFSEEADADYSQYFTSDDLEYAVWNDAANRLYLQRAVPYTLTYENMEGASWQDGAIVPEQYQSGHGLSELPVPVREGYRFDGWYRSEQLLPEELVTAISKKEKGDITIWAKWSDIEAPSITVELADGKDNNLWHGEAAFVLSFADNETSQPNIFVKLDDGKYQPIKGIKSADRWSVTQEGIHTYTFRAEDGAGNVTETPAVIVKLDKTAPVFDAVAFESKANEDGSWNIGESTKNAVVTIMEEHSGVASIEYVMEAEKGEKTAGTAVVYDNRAQFQIPEDFVGMILINCADAVGHQAKELVLRAEKEQIETEPQTETEPKKEPTISKKEQESAEHALRKSNTLTVGSSKLTVKWGKVKSADGYEVYAAVCGEELKLVKTVSADKERTATIKKIGKKKIKKSEEYKVQVKAYRMVDGEKLYLAEGPALHAVGSSHRSKTNVSKLKAAKKTYQIKRGRQAKLSVTATKQNRKKSLLSGGHSAQLRYWSTNKKVASVNARGYIRGKGKGTCYIYAMAQNGVVTRVKVKVK